MYNIIDFRMIGIPLVSSDSKDEDVASDSKVDDVSLMCIRYMSS